MKPEITASIITGCFTLAVTLLTFLLKHLADTKMYTASGKRRDLTGKWKGETQQLNGRKAKLTSGTIKSGSKMLKGDLQVEFGDIRVKIKFKGYYLDDDHILINYISTDPNIKNFGAQVLKINADCNRLTGVTIGYGNVEEGIVQGKTELNKYV